MVYLRLMPGTSEAIAGMSRATPEPIKTYRKAVAGSSDCILMGWTKILINPKYAASDSSTGAYFCLESLLAKSPITGIMNHQHVKNIGVFAQAKSHGTADLDWVNAKG